MLTKRQKQILDFIKDYLKKHGYSPTIKEIADHFGLSSVATVHKHLGKLQSKGYVHKEENQPRSIIPYGEPQAGLVEIPLLGEIAAGEPIEAIENPENIIVPKDLIGKSGRHYALRVRGDSMIDEGIFDGDTVVIREQPVAENGETVVALINGNEVTLKKIYKEKNGFRLQPANPELKPLFIKTLELKGKVISVIRYLETKPKHRYA